MGCHESRTLVWLTKNVNMYRGRRRSAFDRIQRLNIVADPSTHNTQETMALIWWPWQAQVAAHGDLQMIPETKKILPSEQALPESISILRGRGGWREWRPSANCKPYPMRSGLWATGKAWETSSCQAIGAR